MFIAANVIGSNIAASGYSDLYQIMLLLIPSEVYSSLLLAASTLYIVVGPDSLRRQSTEG